MPSHHSPGTGRSKRPGRPVYFTVFDQDYKYFDGGRGWTTFRDFAADERYWEWPGFGFRVEAWEHPIDEKAVIAEIEPRREISGPDYAHALAELEEGRSYDASRHNAAVRGLDRQPVRQPGRRQPEDQYERRHGERLDEVERLVRARKTHREIAAALGVTRSRVSQLVGELRKAGRVSADID